VVRRRPSRSASGGGLQPPGAAAAATARRRPAMPSVTLPRRRHRAAFAAQRTLFARPAHDRRSPMTRLPLLVSCALMLLAAGAPHQSPAAPATPRAPAAPATLVAP